VAIYNYRRTAMSRRGRVADVTAGFTTRGGLVDVELLGDKQLQRDLEAMADTGQRRVMKRAMVKPTALIRKAVRDRVPGSGAKHRALKKGIKAKALRGSRWFIGRFVALPVREALGISENDKSYWPAALEYGHAIVRAGKIVGHVKPHSYLRAGFDAVESRARALLSREVGIGIERELKKSTWA
jgi:hypothetical protein